MEGRVVRILKQSVKKEKLASLSIFRDGLDIAIPGISDKKTQNSYRLVQNVAFKGRTKIVAG
jgi:predicted CoA-binding protein